ncbi:hypothetical protein [Gracilimonas sp.]|uniref:hypothetical protein n=1 Tax=Gracilimonas sp. TaxID=1974203 RepID=UPI0032EAAF85
MLSDQTKTSYPQEEVRMLILFCRENANLSRTCQTPVWSMKKSYPHSKIIYNVLGFNTLKVFAKNSKVSLDSG